MALKTYKKTISKTFSHAAFRWKIALRKPVFNEALNEMFTGIQKINQTYNLPPPNHPDCQSAVEKLGEKLDVERIHKIFPLLEEFKSKLNISFILGDGLPKDLEMIFTVSTAPVRFIWKDNFYSHRYVDFRIDTLADLEVIKNYVAFNMKAIYQNRKQRNINMPDQEFRKFHLSKSDAYIKVFDMRSEKPPVPYEIIALTLQKEGFYKGLGLKKVIDSARKDFSLIFEEIYGVPYKQYDTKKFKSSGIKECATCEKRSQCKELCASISYLLSLEEVKQQHVLGRKTDAREKYRKTSLDNNEQEDDIYNQGEKEGDSSENNF